MPTEAKKATVAELKEDLSSSKATIVADYRGLTVSDIRPFAAPCAARASPTGSSRTAWPRSPPRRPVASELDELLEGPTALAMGSRRRGRPRARLPRCHQAVQDGRRSRRQSSAASAHRRGQRHPAGSAAVARGSARAAGRWHGFAAGDHGVAPRGTAAQPRLRPEPASRPEGCCRAGCRGTQGRSTRG